MEKGFGFSKVTLYWKGCGCLLVSAKISKVQAVIQNQKQRNALGMVFFFPVYGLKLLGSFVVYEDKLNAGLFGFFLHLLFKNIKFYGLYLFVLDFAAVPVLKYVNSFKMCPLHLLHVYVRESPHILSSMCLEKHDI